ncbi:aspartate racemase [Sulfitobacter marinus]|uniref:Aspartate racemase n=1 Tax=Sulfitobacter marinus TaxID=394264 RepID=A0A1I6QFU5_9RHOB|nr:amino acid racemase [Sulfitobacter marinus]SFS51314.1 aspartate racemase [Sulfitobacter marinus]
MARPGLKLGIVGGLGARAGADILNQLVRLTPVKSEGDHREISFEQKPLVEALSVASPDYAPVHRKFYVFDALSRMEKSGCDAAMLPCFITHTFLEELRAELGLKLISMSDAIRKYLDQHHSDASQVGILTTPFVRKDGLFDRILGPNRAAVFPAPWAEDAMIKAIYGPTGFKAGGPVDTIEAAIRTAIESLEDQGAEVIVPGMTEIPVILSDFPKDRRFTILSTNEIYARFALEETGQATQKPFKIGVLGGVGPAATADFMSKIVNTTQAEKDQDHIKVIVEQNPQIPDRTANLVADGADPTLALYATAKKLERGGADIIAIPCNTAHAYVDRLQRHLDIPIVNMLTETVDHIAKISPTVRTVGILATSGTIASRLYQDALRAAGIRAVIPNKSEQDRVMDAIYGPLGVKAGYTSGLCAEHITAVVKSLRAQYADAIILGCTELPLIELDDDLARSMRLIDPTQVLASKCISTSIAMQGAR